MDAIARAPRHRRPVRPGDVHPDAGAIIDGYYASSKAHGSTLITAEEWLTHPGSAGRPMTGELTVAIR